MQRTIHARRARLLPFFAALAAAGLVAGSAYAQNTGGATVTPVGNGTVATTALPSTPNASAAPGAAPGTASGTVVHGTAGTITPPPANATPGQVVAGGKVPDEATKAAVLQKLRDTYGAANVVDQIEVGDVATPPNWSTNVQKLLGAQLKQISKGQLKINGTQIEVKGEVHNEAQRQQLASDMANSLNPTYTIKNGLRVSASEQGVLDQTLANRTIEFETGSATLTPQGKQILDQMAAALAKMQNRTVDIIGHTDNSGNRTSNIALSQARADAVKGYLITKGIQPQQMTTTGVGPDQPIAPNDTADGRARNRRIEFRVGQ
ncbi:MULTISPECIES: OmpA family protein [Burkholderia]|jgi:OOP family OmpA-OmpF porin|uniref:OmpA family protein n=1 Tax=Burkholderia TaxID=32008 RepID=UPI00025F0C83|nr:MULTISPECIES: OmpA family protein [Burkholderia]AFJ84769.1 Outer membrane lipoprotein omp16 precursor [Burkholderia sp. KJ006]AOJ12433.1 cell envelope biogenesis protein OmpA [Burkholderia vietnamiensis]KVE28280.1 cell envelope biogenesis protein OmpA [Burkholderia vietnamiensis]KVE69515.1 cell envelope biogenesis protein OmpA [Burkholderia vietnamiensis]KVE72035.1 cell envelope biogenesis protein OmpA [Burkholderia vietnamiensis]